MKIEVSITKEVLRKSMWCGCWQENNLPVPKDWDGYTGHADTNCAIAKAIMEIFPYSWTTGSDISVWLVPDSKTKRYDIPLPESAKEFIGDFDYAEPRERLKLKPFSFKIDIPEELINEIGIEEAKDIIAKSETLELV